MAEIDLKPFMYAYYLGLFVVLSSLYIILMVEMNIIIIIILAYVLIILKLEVFDNLLKIGLSSIAITDLSEVQWIQTSLSVRAGGTGVR
jgi:hypothetical protein